MGYPIQQNQTAQPLLFLMVDSSDHITGKTGLTPTVTLSKAGSAFAAPAGAVTEIGNGWYQVAGNATDAATLGPLLLHATAAGADPTDDRFDVVAYNPQDAAGLGLSRLDQTVGSRLANSDYTAPPTADAIGTDAAGKILATPANKLATDASGKVMAATVDALGAQAKADVNAEVDTALAEYDAPTKAELDAGLAGLNDLDATAVQNAAAAAITAYDPPTKAEMDAALLTISNAIGALNDYDGSDTAGTVTLLARLTDLRAGYLDKLNVSGTLAHSDAASTYKADVSALALEATAGAAKTAAEAVKGQTDKLQFGAGNDLKATLDGEAVKVGSLEQAALAQFVTTDTGQSVAGDGSVAKISQGGEGGGTSPWSQEQRDEVLDGLVEIKSSLASAGGVPGPGADRVTLTISVNGGPLADADVWVTSDAGGANVVAGTLQTNSAGQVTFLLDAGVTYYIWAQKDGVNPIRGQSFVAEAD